MAKKIPIEVQKGPIKCDMPTMKTITPEQRAQEDYEHRVLKKSGQVNHLHIPK